MRDAWHTYVLSDVTALVGDFMWKQPLIAASCPQVAPAGVIWAPHCAKEKRNTWSLTLLPSWVAHVQEDRGGSSRHRSLMKA